MGRGKGVNAPRGRTVSGWVRGRRLKAHSDKGEVMEWEMRSIRHDIGECWSGEGENGSVRHAMGPWLYNIGE